MQGDEVFTGPSICVIAAGGLTPDLSDQTLQDYQVLRVKTEAEALANSGADVFLWLTAAGKLRPRALEECVWALQSADWVTWEDTGAAPAPSMRDVAGPLGVSRRALEWPEPKPGGTVRRLPWRCLSGPAERHAEESIPAHATRREAKRTSRWRTRAADWMQYVNRKLRRPFFDLSSYVRFDPNASYVNGLLLRPLRYAVEGSRGRRRVAITIGSLGEGEAQRALVGIVEAIDRDANEVIVIVEKGTDKSWKQRWMECSNHIFEVGAITTPPERERMILSLALNWQIDALLVAEAPAAYRVLPALKERLPGLRAADVVADLDALDLSDDTIDSFDFRLARSHAVAKGLEGMSLEGQQVRWVPYGVDPAKGNGPLGTEIAVGFRGRLDSSGGADRLAALAGELQRLHPEARVSWIIAGTGPLESRVRQAFEAREATFVGDREPAADVLLVLSEDASGDRFALEALRRGTPVVAFQTDSREEVVAPGCGVLVTGGHDGEFRAAAALAELIRDGESMAAMSAAARNHAATNYSPVSEATAARSFLEEFFNDRGGKIQLWGS